MSKQTALQKAIEQIENRMKVTKNEVRWGELNKIHIMLKTLLPYERETIEAAYKDGGINSKAMAVNGFSKYKNSQDYFAKTYSN
jgi:hypothetical protein